MSWGRHGSPIGEMLMFEPRTALERLLLKQTLRAVRHVIRRLGGKERAAKYLGVSVRTLQRWQAKHPSLKV